MKQPDASMPPPQPVSILRRSISAGGGASKKKKNSSPGAASFSQSAHTFDAECDAPARMPNSDDSFRKHRGDSIDSGNSNFTPITDPNELADRILNFQRSYASSLSNAAENYLNNDGKKSPTPMRGGQRYRPPPPPPRSTSSGKKRNKGMNSSAKDIDHPKYCDEADEDYEYVRRMERIKLDQEDDSPQFSASSSEYNSDTLRRTNMNEFARSSPPPPPKLPFAAKTKNDELNRNVNESLLSVNSSNKFNSSSTTVNSSKESFVPRPVRVSQFEEKWEAQQNQNSDTGTPPTKPKMAMASSLSTSSHVPKNLEASPSSLQPVVSSTPQNCDKHGRCKYHPQYKLYKKKLLGGYEFISTCPMCDAKLEAKNNRTGSGDNPSRGRNRSRSKERGRIKSTDQVSIESNLGEGDNFNAFKSSPGRSRTRRSKSADRAERRQRRPRTRRVDNRDNDLHDSIDSGNSNSFGKSFTNTLESIRDKLPSHPPPPPSRQNRSHSREGRRLTDQSMDVGKSLENGLRAIDKGKRGGNRDKKSSSSSYDGTEIRKKKNLGNNQFVHEGSELNFDKKTGRCKKHPSVVLAKKSKFRSGSWEVIKQNGCPLCAKAGGAPVRDEIGQDLDEDTKRKMDMLLRGQDTSGDTSSQWSKSVETRSGSASAPNQSIIDQIPAEGIRGNKVSRMLYTTPMGETGWYTGEIDFERNPHGQGRMRYKTGHSYEGQWIHGYGEVHLENLNRMKAGFGTNKAAWNQSEMAPSVRKAAPNSSKSMSSRSAVHQHQYQQQSSNQGYLSAQMQHVQQHQQYAQMQQQQQQMQLQQQQAQMQQVWANMSPQERQMAMSQWYASSGMPSQPGYQMQGYPPM